MERSTNSPSARPSQPALPTFVRPRRNPSGSIRTSPNPFSGPTRISFSLAAAASLSLVIYDASGNTMATLTRGDFEAGDHLVTFDPSGLASGIYRCRLAINGGATISRMMVYLK